MTDTLILVLTMLVAVVAGIFIGRLTDDSVTDRADDLFREWADEYLKSREPKRDSRGRFVGRG